ncbi:hypothetical protein BVG16_05325 [Paenibacillus selenitireducens]|uniref:Uncharacterized protein n=1 Tax=Paenibacillus selenitireducens TaxID=1324314 RepID=A0A1T2XJW6_9BACL|nr:glycosyltransferase family 4 protein [Paenibacillus selenitireducens]OPA80167.1 hypothetical protein BVG16_05325 [Paenibacillus selenitireducens]
MMPKMMLFSHICNPIYITGAEKLLLFFIQEWMPHYQCVLVVPNEGALSKQAKALGIEIIVLPCPLLYSIYQPNQHVRGELEVLKQNAAWGHLLYLLRLVQPDMVMTNTCVHVLPAVAAKSLGIPTVWQITETMVETEWVSLSVGIIDEYADHIIGISQATMRSFQAAGLQGKITILSPSWHMERLEPEQWSHYRTIKRMQLRMNDSTKLIGYISSYIYPNKGLYHFLKMALQISKRYSHVAFVILGKPKDEPYFQKCMSLVQKSNHFHQFHFIRFEHHIQAIYPAMDMVVIPSLTSEGFGMTALEGLIFGKPVIAYRSGGLSEIMQATANDEYLVEPGDIDGLAQRVSFLLDHPEQAEYVGQLNHQRVMAAFGIDQYRIGLQSLMSNPALQVRNRVAMEPIVAPNRKHAKKSKKRFIVKKRKRTTKGRKHRKRKKRRRSRV